MKNLEKKIKEHEDSISNLFEECKAKIIWNDSYKYIKSPIAFVYLHGFGASHREGNPIITELAKEYNANLYLSRLAGHGLNDASGYKNLTPEKYILSAKKAIEIGKQIGQKVIVIGTSTGGTLSLKLASEDNNIDALILYSPFIDVKNEESLSILTPKGKEYIIEKNKGEIFKENRPKEQLPYWSTKYHINGYIALLQLLKNNMNSKTFNRVNCPIFLGYYYKDKEHQDDTVSVDAMLSMFKQLGTDNHKKIKVSFPDTNDHVISCDLRSEDWKSVYKETNKFIKEKILN